MALALNGCKLCVPPGARPLMPAASQILGAKISKLQSRFPNQSFNLPTPSVTACHSLPPDPAIGISQPTRAAAAAAAPQQKSYDFEALMRSTRGSQQGPGNEDLDALTDLGAALPTTVLVFLQRLPLHGLTTDVLTKLIAHCSWGHKEKGKDLQGSRPLWSLACIPRSAIPWAWAMVSLREVRGWEAGNLVFPKASCY